jgi:hypothetical protein
MRRLSVTVAAFSVAVALLLVPATGAAQQDPEVIFAVITKIPKDRRLVMGQISTGGPASEGTLVPNEAVVENPIWKKLEICHSLRAEAWKTAEGYQLASIRILDAGMLPMVLQGLAGDCLLKKALEYAPQID